MKVLTLTVGSMMENCYLVYEKKQAVVIDPGADAGDILDALKKNDLKVTHILLTHGHYDHIGAVQELKDITGAKICIHQDDAEMLKSARLNLSMTMGSPAVTYNPDIFLYDGQIIETGGMSIRVIHTPGHTPGGVCFEIGENLFTGDTLFNRSVGRTDFPGGSIEQLNRSMNNVLKKISKDYIVYPGHGPFTTLDYEKKNNPFMRGMA
jgi:glyoxylase-like metal-dependent hydrolase (beta-lactamase superfamily II)